MISRNASRWLERVFQIRNGMYVQIYEKFTVTEMRYVNLFMFLFCISRQQEPLSHLSWQRKIPPLYFPFPFLFLSPFLHFSSPFPSFSLCCGKGFGERLSSTSRSGQSPAAKIVLTNFSSKMSHLAKLLVMLVDNFNEDIETWIYAYSPLVVVMPPPPWPT